MGLRVWPRCLAGVDDEWAESLLAASSVERRGFNLDAGGGCGGCRGAAWMWTGIGGTVVCSGLTLKEGIFSKTRTFPGFHAGRPSFWNRGRAARALGDEAIEGPKGRLRVVSSRLNAMHRTRPRPPPRGAPDLEPRDPGTALQASPSLLHSRLSLTSSDAIYKMICTQPPRPPGLEGSNPSPPSRAARD